MKFWINVSPVSGKVYIGKINKAGNLFLEKEEIEKAHAVEIAIEILKSHIEPGSSGTTYESQDETVEFTVSKHREVDLLDPKTYDNALKKEIEMKISNLEAQIKDIEESQSDKEVSASRTEIRKLKINILKDVLALGTTNRNKENNDSPSTQDA